MKLVKMTGTHKKKLVIAIVGFIVVMIMLTILSRVVASFAVVEVEVSSASRNTISETIEASATAQMRQEVAVRTEPEQTIETFYVAVGDTIKNGDKLFKVRTDDLDENILELEENRHLKQLRIEVLYEQIDKARSAANTEQSPADQAPVVSDNTDELNYQLASEILERDRLDRSLEKLYVLRAAKGVVHAPTGGTISNVSSRVGDVTSQSAVVLIADNSAGTKLVFSVDSTQAASITSDTAISATNTATKEVVEGIKFAGITQNTSSSAMMDVTLYLPAKSVAVGNMLNVKITISSATYNSCIPLSALHQTGSGAYVFVVEEEQSELGTEQVARSVNVSVLAHDSRMAAVEGIGQEQQVVVKAAKMLTDKDRVLVLND